MKFNYNRYQKSVVTKQSLRVDDGGLILKAAGSATDVTESGDVIDIALAEVQDELVNLAYKNPVTFAEFTNISYKNFEKSTPGWVVDDRYVRMRGQTIGSDVNAVRYDETSDPPSAYIQVNKNIGTDETTSDIAEFQLIPAHKLIGESHYIDMSSKLIHIDDILDIDASGFTMHFVHAIHGSPLFNFIKKNDRLVNAVDSELCFGEILDGYDTLGYQVSINVDIPGYGGGVYPVTGVTTSTTSSTSKFLKRFVHIRVDDGGVLYAALNASTYARFTNTGKSVSVGYISGYSYKTPLSTSLNVDELGLLGIWGSPSQKTKDIKKRRGYLTKKQLRKNLRNLAKPLNDYGIDIVAIPYEEKLTEISEAVANANPGPWVSVVAEMNPDGTVNNPSYYRDVNYSFLRRKYKDGGDDAADGTFSTMMGGIVDSMFSDGYRDATVADAISASKRFKSVQRRVDYGYLVDLTTDDISPFTSSLREVLVAKYGPANLLLDELNEIHDELRSITDDHGVFDDGLSYYLSDIFTPDEFSNELFSKIFANRCGDVLSTLGDYIDKMRVSAIGGSIFTNGASLLILAFIDDLVDVYNRLRGWYKRAKRFEYYVGESVIGNGMSVGELNESADPTPRLIDRGYYGRLPRYLVPVDYGHQKVKYRRKNWLGKVEVATRKKDLGIRWVEIRFVNAFVYNLHRKSEQITGLQIPESYTPSTYLNLGIESITLDYVRGKSSGVLDYIDTINKLLASDIPATITLKSPITDVSPGTSIFFEIRDSSNVLSENKSKIAAMWNGVVLNSNQVAFLVPGVLYSLYGRSVALDNLTVSRYIKPFPATKPSINPINCQLEYKIPYLPTDTDIRDYVFHTYGPIDQSEFAMRWSEFKQLNEMGLGAGSTYGGAELVDMLEAYASKYPRTTGFQIFRDSSDSISDMQSVYDIHQKVSFLYTILCDAFGTKRVKIVETVRSHDDQETLQVGGPSSNFLSWHNYGLSIKINIYEADSSLVTIRDGSGDFFRLMKLAEAFTDAALVGKLGEPCNVVWCGRLKTGPNIFVWEFLPLGIGHKDAIKFRDAYFNQMDPFECVKPIDVDAGGYVKSTAPFSRMNVPTTEKALDRELHALVDSIDVNTASTEILDVLGDVELLYEMETSMSAESRLCEKQDAYRSLKRLTTPYPVYITKTSNAYNNAYVHIDGGHYVSPIGIPNYPITKELVMKDIQEYFFMIANKFKGNGATLKDDQRVIDWKLTNPISFKQMLMFYSLIGSFTVTRSLLAADYISRYESLVTSANIDPIKFVRDFLGMRSYMDIKIYPDGLERDAGYITLHDGRLSVSVLQCRSIHPEGYMNMFGEHQSTFLTIEFGQVNDGIFIPEYSKDSNTGVVTKNHMRLIKSKTAVLSGYAPDGSIIGPRGYTLSTGETLSMGDGYMLHVLIKDKILDEIKSIKEMFDGLKTEFLYDNFSNSPNQNQTIENEFGVIASQDLLTFDDLADVYRRLAINNTSDTNSMGDKQGVGNTSGIDVNDDEALDPNRDQSVYEKLVSTTQYTGIQFSRNTKEKPKIEPMQKSKLESIIMRLSGDRSPDVRDII